VGVQVKLWNPSRTRVIPERFCGGDSLRGGAISSICTCDFTLPYCPCVRSFVIYFMRSSDGGMGSSRSPEMGL